MVNRIDFTKVKLIIWDLDDTFWKGTLSEGEIHPVPSNIELIKKLTNRGIINSICSKNDREPVEKKLKEFDVDYYFVFNSIDWQPKGQRTKKLIEDMGLRPVNVLFLDDNEVNLNEVSYYCNGIMTGGPEEIKELESFIDSTNESDKKHSRLNQYKVLEKKQTDKSHFSSNEELLYESKTRVEMFENCRDHIDRIHDLLMRSNQLNYTKKRITKEELLKTIDDPNVKSGYVTVSDKYGDYGIVGFYAVKNESLVHFLFSCRTIGQGVEQFVYAKLGYPSLHVEGKVISLVDNSPAPKWINNIDKVIEDVNTTSKTDTIKILFKGPCDLLTTVSYLSNSASIDTEFDYISKSRGNNISQQSHSFCITQTKSLSVEERALLLKKCAFVDEELFNSKVFSGNYDIIFISTIRDSVTGLYQHKKTGIKVPFGIYMYPLTDKSLWDDYINNTTKVDAQQNIFSEEYLNQFLLDFEFVGRISISDYRNNIKYIIDHVPAKTKLCFILGSEKLFSISRLLDKELIDMHVRINDVIREFSMQNERVCYIDVNDLISSEGDYTDSVDHYNRIIYYKIAEEIKEIIEKEVGEKIHVISLKAVLLDNLLLRLSKQINHNSRLFSVLKKGYLDIRKYFLK